MKSILTAVKSQVNTQIQKTDYVAAGYVPDLEHKRIKSIHHKASLAVCSENGYTPYHEKILQTIINHSTLAGVSTIARDTIAKKCRISVRTVHRHMEKFQADGLIICDKRGWKASNTTTLLFTKHLNLNKSDRVSHKLTSPIINNIINNIEHKGYAVCDKSELNSCMAEYEQEQQKLFAGRWVEKQRNNPVQKKSQQKDDVRATERPPRRESSPNRLKHRPNDLIGVTLLPSIQARIEEKFPLEHQANEVSKLANELKCTDTQKMTVVNRLAERKANMTAKAIRSLGATMMTIFKFYLIEIGDQYNFRNKNLLPMPSSLTNLNECPALQIELEPRDIERVKEKWLDSGLVTMNAMCERISPTQTLADVLFFHEGLTRVKGQENNLLN